MIRSAGPRSWLLLIAVAFGLNLVWEYAQLPLYAGGTELPTSIMLRATTTDAVLILIAAAVALPARRRSMRAPWLVLVGTLLATAAFIEVRAALTDRWSYTEVMPTIGVVGLSPLLQLPLTGSVAVAVARPWRRARRS